MRHALTIATLLACLALPFTVLAQDADEEDDSNAEAFLQALAEGDGIPQANFGEQDEHGWFLRREDGVCSMTSFNDRTALQVDPANPLNTMLKFQLFDGEMPEAHGTQLPALLGVRDSDGADYQVYNVTVTVSKSTIPAYLLPTPMAELVAQHPNGFELLLKDPSAQNTLGASDTIGSGAHLAALVACAP
jgi:hypothetical protein